MARRAAGRRDASWAQEVTEHVSRQRIRSGASSATLERSGMETPKAASSKSRLAPGGASSLVELYELRLAARFKHASQRHAPGTGELILVLTGNAGNAPWRGEPRIDHRGLHLVRGGTGLTGARPRAPPRRAIKTGLSNARARSASETLLRSRYVNAPVLRRKCRGLWPLRDRSYVAHRLGRGSPTALRAKPARASCQLPATCRGGKRVTRDASACK